MRTVRTACTYDCPDGCGLLVDVDEDQVEVRGDPEHPITRGFVCRRIRRHAARLRDADRLTTPLVRHGEGFRPVFWDEALDLAAARLGEALRADPASVVYVQGGGSLGLRKLLCAHFWRSLGRITTLRGGVCGEAGEEAQHLDFGDCAGHDPTDLANSGAIVLWGKNSEETGPHLIPFVREARARGVPVALVEIRPTPTEKLADRVVRVAPSGDGFLALAVLRLLRDRDALDAAACARTENFPAFDTLLSSTTAADFATRAGTVFDDVEFLADLYSSHRPAATHLGWGLQRRASGAANVRCIGALALLSGNVGVAGGGATFTSWRRRGLDTSMLAPATGRTVSAPDFARDLAGLRDPEPRFVFVCAANPVSQFADSHAVARALRGARFVVTADAFLTDTAQCADLVLPVTLMLEEEDVVGSYQHHHVARARRAVDPPPGARADEWITRELRRRLGLPPDPLIENPDAALERLAAPWLLGDAPRRNPRQESVPFARTFPTPSGLARLPERLPEPVPDSDDWPLVLGSFSNRAWQTSQRPAREQTGPPECFVHPDAPGAAGLRDGAIARLCSPVGEIDVHVRLDARMPARLCVVHRGGSVRLGRGANALVAARATDLGEGTAFYDQRVRLRPR